MSRAWVLSDHVSLIRSKNAGPFVLTIDVMFKTAESYRRFKALNCIDVKGVAKAYGMSANQITLQFIESANAVKISMPRVHAQGDPRDSDNYQGQQYAPIMEMIETGFRF